MKWTGADIIVQLEEGWELDEIAAATGLGIAEVNRLLREQRYKKRKKKQQAASKEVAMVASQEEQEEATAEVRESSAEEVELTAHTPQSSISLSAFDGAPSCTTIEKRGKSSHPKWAHYKHAPVEELEGDFTSQLRTAFWIEEGTTFEPLEVSECAPKKPTSEPAKAEVAAPPEVNLADKAARIALLERSLAASRSKVEDLEASLDDAKTYCDERDDRIEALEVTIGDLRCQVCERDELVAHFQADAKRWEAKAKQLEQQLAAHRDVSSSMVERIDHKELERIAKKSSLVILEARQQQHEHVEALLQQGFDLVQALEQEGVHLPVEARAWLWDVSKVEGAA